MCSSSYYFFKRSEELIFELQELERLENKLEDELEDEFEDELDEDPDFFFCDSAAPAFPAVDTLTLLCPEL